jgi:asparagine synthase (glutamine-hydrolysing)
MCGIAGIIQTNPSGFSKEHLQKMTDALAHRGPDGEGFWQHADNISLLGHRRLSILDLSATGAQPMHYLDRYVVIHNGEIYNYIELKAALQKKGYSFKSNTDTEVIAAAYDCWKEECVQQCSLSPFGMKKKKCCLPQGIGLVKNRFTTILNKGIFYLLLK